MKDVSFRKIISLTSLIAFFFLALTGAILYIVPHGRVAYWADWHLGGLTKEEWQSIHINLALLFLITSGFHIYYNWKAIVAYLKNKTKQLVIFNREFTVAFFVAVILVICTYFSIPPFKTVIDINDKIKQRQERVYGSPPYGHAELSSMVSFCKKMGLDIDKSMKILARNNIKGVDQNETLKEIAKANRISPQQVYLFIKDAAKTATGQSTGTLSGSQAPTGLGRKTLAQVSREYNFDLKLGLAKLTRKNIQAIPDMTFKEAAEMLGMSPIDLFETMK